MDNEKILVSVYCLAFNHGKYIRDALEGFVNQKTSFKYEVIVHDDASMDNTAEIIKEYAEKYPEIIKPIYQEKNVYSQGISILQTYIYPRLKGEYVAICEGDDYWIDENKLQKQVDVLEKCPECSACVHNTLLFDMRDHSQREMFANKNKMLELKDVMYGGSTAYHTSSLMYRKQYVYNRPAYVSSIKSVGDYPLSIYLTTQGSIMYLSDTMSLYRYNVNGSWTDRQSKNKNAERNMYEKMMNMLIEAKKCNDKKYQKDFEKAIIWFEYKVKLFDEGYGILKDKKYRECFRRESMKTKTKFFLLKYCSFVFAMYQAIKKARKSKG